MKYTLFPFILCTPLKYANIAVIFSVVKNNISPPKIKICIIEVYLLNYYFESHLISKWSNYRQTIFYQLNLMIPHVDIIGLSHSVAIL